MFWGYLIWQQIKQSALIKFLMDEKCKPYEIYSGRFNVYEETCFSKKKLKKKKKKKFTSEIFIEVWNNIQDKNRPDGPTMKSIPKVVLKECKNLFFSGKY